MQTNTIEQEILLTVHDLPLDKQQSILDFSLFIKSLMINVKSENKALKHQMDLGQDAIEKPIPKFGSAKGLIKMSADF